MFLRTTNDAGGDGNGVPGERRCEEVRGSTTCRPGASSEMSSCREVSDRGVDEPGEEVTATAGDTASSEVDGAEECSIMHSGTATVVA